MGTNVDPVCGDDKSYLEKIAGGGVTPRYLGTYQTLAALKADWPDSMGDSMKDSWAMVAGTQYTYGGAGVGWEMRAPAIAGHLIAAYESESMRSEIQGYRNEARSGLPIAGDTPTISASATVPASDTDAAAQEINIFNSAVGDTEYLSNSQKAAGKKWIRGWNQNLKAGIFGDVSRLCRTLTQVGTNGNQDQDNQIEPGTSWGVGCGNVVTDMWLDSDVLFIRTWSGASSKFELFIDGSLCTNATIGANILADTTGRMFYGTVNGYVKIKFGTAKRRRVTLMHHGILTPRSLHTRVVSSITPVSAPPVWIHSGDSFSEYAISDSNSANNTPSLSLVEWMHSMYGFSFDFINIAIGGTSLSNTSQVLPATQLPYTAGLKPSQRKTFKAITAGLNASIITCLFGHNDANNYATALFESEFRAFISDAREMHPKAVIVIFGSNASPGIITNGNAVNVENKMKALCYELGVHFVPLQTEVPALIIGTGNQGATNGTGNTDLYIGPDNTHPTAKGHRDGYGLPMARKLYEVMRLIS